MIPFAYLAHRAVIVLEGEESVALLERLLTNRVDNQAVGEARYTALLTPQGKIITDFFLVRTATGFVIDCPAEARDDLMKRLKLFRLRAKVDISAPEDVFVIASVEDVPAERGMISGASLWFRDPRLSDVVRFRAVCEAGEWASWHGPNPAEWAIPLPAWHEDRVALGLPEFGVDFGAVDVFPPDVNMDLHQGVDLKKGCFVGQEVVSRMHRRGNIRKRTITLEGEGLVEGAVVRAGESTLGEVTSVAGGKALARVRVDRLARAGGRDAALLAGEAEVQAGVGAWLDDELAAAG